MSDRPEELAEALRAVRETGRANMWDRQGVADVAETLGYGGAADWMRSLDRHARTEYLGALKAAFGEEAP